MAVQARMKCVSVTDVEGASDPTKQIVLEPVDADDGTGNESYSKWTPWGRLELGVTNPAAFDQFKPGSVYDIHISPTE
jgi:hypothetical protein